MLRFSSAYPFMPTKLASHAPFCPVLLHKSQRILCIFSKGFSLLRNLDQCVHICTWTSSWCICERHWFWWVGRRMRLGWGCLLMIGRPVRVKLPFQLTFLVFKPPSSHRSNSLDLQILCAQSSRKMCLVGMDLFRILQVFENIPLQWIDPWKCERHWSPPTTATIASWYKALLI